MDPIEPTIPAEWWEAWRKGWNACAHRGIGLDYLDRPETPRGRLEAAIGRPVSDEEYQRFQEAA